MRALLFLSAFAGFNQAYASIATTDYVDLEPVPRHLWDPELISLNSDLSKRDDAEANVTLSDHEQMLWSTGNKTGTNHSTIVSLVTWTPQSQRIIDMAKFAWELQAVRCTSDMMLQFRHNISFQAAKREWEWVNFNTMRSFVMVADHIKCGKNWSADPWVVSRAVYHAHNLTILLHAEKSTWKKVTRSYMLDFGEIQRDSSGGPGGPGGSPWPPHLAKRQFDFNFDGAFTLNLASSWPRTFINRTWSGTKFSVTCADCGVQGALEFAGHIEGSVFGGLDHLMLSARPLQLGAALNLEASLSGFYNFAGKDWASDEFELFSIPLPSGWRIPGVLTFGPNAKLLAGYELTSIAGQATVTAGISASIPDSSIAKLDLISAERVEVSGWLPTFNFQPPTLTQGGITAKGKVWGKLAVAVSLEIFDEDGITADVYVKIPLSIEAEVGYDELGFCEGSTDPFGASLELDLGAEVGLEAWKELNGNKDVFFEQVIFSDYEVIELPELCISFGGAPEGACLPDMDSDAVRAWYDNEVNPYRGGDDGDDFTAAKANTSVAPAHAARAQLERRAKDDAEWDYYNLDCDPRNRKAGRHSNYKIKLKGYPSPTDIQERGEAGLSVPIMKVGIDGCADPTVIDACVPTNWVTRQTDDENDLNGVTSWNSEHVYEGNWIRNFLDHLQKTYFPGDSGCTQIADLFDIGETTGYTSQMLDCIGTSRTYTDTMTLFPLRENGYKFRVRLPPAPALVRGHSIKIEHDLHGNRPSPPTSPPSTPASDQAGTPYTTVSAP